jgi:hypothetical protein
MQLNTINHLIEFLSVNNINDFNTINKLVMEMTGRGFMPIRFSNREPTPLDYYIKWLNIYQDKMTKGLELPIWIDVSVPFEITDIYKR